MRDKGFIRSKRKGPTGIGCALETELGIKENNIAIPDLGFAELKSHRENYTGLVTLFTFNKKAWRDSVAEKFSQKMKAIILVSAKVELRDGREYFYYYRARFLTGNMDKQGLINAFTSGDFLIDLRLHDKVTMARNHGTGFRVKENKLINLFSNISEIEL